MKSWVYSEDSGRDNEYIFSTSVVVSAREEADVGKLASSDQWAETEADEKQRVWTDDYSNVLGAVYRRLRGWREMGFLNRAGPNHANSLNPRPVNFFRACS